MKPAIKFISILSILSNFLSTAVYGNLPDSVSVNNDVVVFFSEKDCEKTGIKPLELQEDEIMLPQYDGKYYFIETEGYANTNEENLNPLAIQTVIDNAKKTGNVLSISDIGSLISGAANLNFKSLPIVIELEGGSLSGLKIVVLSLKFSTRGTKADIAIVSESKLKNKEQRDEIFYLGAKDILITKGGGLKGQFSLISPREIELFELRDVGKLNLTAGTGFCLGCEGTDKKIRFILGGSFDFNPDIAVAENEEGEAYTGDNRIAKLLFGIEVSNWNDCIITTAFPSNYGIQFKKFKEIGFWSKTSNTGSLPNGGFCVSPSAAVGANIILDFSSIRNQDNLPASEPFKGMYLSNFRVRLPKQIKEENDTRAVFFDLTHLYLTENGVFANASLSNITKNVKLGKGYDGKVKSFSLLIERSELKAFTICGDLRTPITKENDYSFEFGLGLSQEGNARFPCNLNSVPVINAKPDPSKPPATGINKLIFSAAVKSTSKDQMKVNLFKNNDDFYKLATLKFCKAGIAMIVEHWKLDEIFLSISKADVTIMEGTNSPFANIGFHIEEITIKNKLPFIESLTLFPSKKTDCENSPLPQQLQQLNIGGFGIGISNLTIQNDPLIEAGLLLGTTVNVSLGKSINESTTTTNDNNPAIAATGALSMKIKLIENGGKYSFEYEKLTLNKINVEASLKSFGFKGTVDLFKNEKKFGMNIKSGFFGDVSFWFKTPGGGTATTAATTPNESVSVGAQASIVFMNIDKTDGSRFNAWGVDVAATLNPGIIAGPVTIDGIFGGAYKNMAFTGDKMIGVRTGLQYKIDEGNWGFNIGLDMGIPANDNVSIKAMLAAEGTKGLGLKWIKGIGYAKMKVEPIAPTPIGEEMKNGDFAGMKSDVKKVGEPTSQIGNNEVEKNKDVGQSAKKLEPSPQTNNNRVGAGVIITQTFGTDGTSPAFTMLMYPDIQIHLKDGFKTSLESQGSGILYIAQEKQYLHLGKTDLSKRIGLNFSTYDPVLQISTTAGVGAYFMLGHDLPTELPPMIVPPTFQSAFETKKSGLQARSTLNYSNPKGLAMGMNAGFRTTIKSRGVFSSDVSAGIGFDALLINQTAATCQDGWSGETGKGWSGAAQIYGYATVNTVLFSVPLVNFGLGFMLKASVPKPVYAKGVFLIYAKVWKAQVDLKMEGEIGNCGTLPPDPAPVVIEEKAKLITNLSPSGTKKLAPKGNLYLDCYLPTDQIGNAGTSNFKQRVIIKIKQNGNEITTPIIIEGLDPKINPEKAIKLALPNSLQLNVNQTYQFEITTNIYAIDEVTESDGRSSNTFENGAVVEYTYTDGSVQKHIKLEETKTYDITTGGQEYEITDSDVVIYPARDQFNVYTQDYEGQGYFKLDTDFASKITSSCTGCQFKIGIYNNSNLIGSTYSIVNLSGETNFALPVLLNDTKYEIKIIGNINGTDEILYKDHYFRTDAAFDSFVSKINEINTNNETVFNGTDLLFDIEYKGGKSMKFSAEEDRYTIESNIIKGPWFTDFQAVYNDVVPAWNWPTPLKSTLKQNNSYSLENGILKEKATKYSNANFMLEYSPFNPTIFQYLQDLARTSISGGIPLFTANQHCVNIVNDIQKMPYYASSSRKSIGNLPSRFGIINQDICFRNENDIDFNDLSKIQKEIIITCNRKANDSQPLTFSFELKKGTEILTFPTGFEIIHTNNAISQAPKNESFVINDVGQFFTSKLKSVETCPTIDKFSISEDVPNTLGYRIISVVINQEQNIKPCLSFEEITKSKAYESCLKLCRELGGDPSCIESCNGNLVTSTDNKRYFLVKSWENESRNASQKLRETISFTFNNGISGQIADGTSFVEIEMEDDEVRDDLKIDVTASSSFKCGENINKVVLDIYSYAAAGSGAKIEDVCISTEPVMLYSLIKESEAKIGTLIYADNATKPYPLANGYFAFSRPSSQKEWFFIQNGELKQKGFCSTSPVIDAKCEIRTKRIGGRDEQFKYMTFTFFTDANKTTPFIPQNIPDVGFNIILTDGQVLNIPKNLITSSSGEIKLNGNLTCDGFGVGSTNLEGSSTNNPPNTNCPSKPAPPTIVSSKASVLFGETITLTAAGCAEKTVWTNGKKDNSISEIITRDSEYSAHCLLNGCLSEKATSIVKLINFEIKTNDNKDFACLGVAKTLIVEGCGGNITWTSDDNSLVISNPTQSSITVLITQNTTFTVKCSSTNNSEKSTTKRISLYQSPSSPTITHNIAANQNLTICSGESVSLSATACSTGSLLWSNGETSESISVTPTAATNTYFAVCKDINCSSATSNTIEIKALSLTTPNLSVQNANNNHVCINQSFTLTATNCASNDEVFWYLNNSELSQRGTTISTTLTTQGSYNYSARCKRNISTNPSIPKWCQGELSSNQTISVINGVNLTLEINNSNICAYQNATLITNGCNLGIVQWQKPSTTTWETIENNNTNLITNIAGNYKVRCNLNNNCFNTEHAANNDLNKTLNVYSEPLAPTNLSSGDLNNQICNGSSISLSANCESGKNLIWKTGTTTLTSTTFIPTVTATYQAYCSSTITPTLTCITQTASTIDVKVNPIPTVPTVSASNGDKTGSAEICFNEKTNLTATICINGENYWKINDILQSTPTNSINDITVSGKYAVKCVVGECESSFSKDFNLIVHSLPATPTITSSSTTFKCGGSITLTSNCIAGTTNHWYDATNTDVGDGITITFNSTATNGTYTAKCKNNTTSCFSENSIGKAVEIRPVPAATISGNAQICNGESLTLTATNCTGGSILWSSEETTGSITVNPTSTTTYTLTCTINNCSNTTSHSVTVYAYPVAPTVLATYQCDKTTLSITNCAGGTARFLNTIDNVSFTPSIDATTAIAYTPSCTKNGCKTDGTNYTPNIVSTPSVPTILAGKNLICNGETTSISIVGNSLYSYIRKFDNIESTTDFASINNTGDYFIRATRTQNKISCSVESNYVAIVAATAPTPSVSQSHHCGYTTLSINNINITSAGFKDVDNNTYSKTFNATSSINYTPFCDVSGCITTGTAINPSITVTPTASVIYAGKTTLCNGESTDIRFRSSGSGSKKCYFNEIEIDAFLNRDFVNIKDAGVYSVINTNIANGVTCVSTSNPITISTISPPTPIIEMTYSNPKCDATLSVSNCSGTVSWTKDRDNYSGTLTVNDHSNYRAKCTIGSCVSSESNASCPGLTQPKTPTVTTLSQTICSGSTVNLAATGCENDDYVWKIGDVILSNTSVAPTATTTYTAYCETNGSCLGTGVSITITVVAPAILSDITVKEGVTAFCLQSSLELNATCTNGSIAESGWSNGQKTISNSGTYTVTCVNATCGNVVKSILIGDDSPKGNHELGPDYIEASCSVGSTLSWYKNGIFVHTEDQIETGRVSATYYYTCASASCGTYTSGNITK